MGTTKVVEWVDIQAPRQEVFDLVLKLERRMQLSPLWGLSSIQEISANYPEEGSTYRVKMIKGDPVEYNTIITSMVPQQKLAYRLTVEQNTGVTWTFQDVTQGTRVIYEEQFDVGEDNKEAFTDSVRQVVHQWLGNIKRYSELRGSRSRRFLKWLMDRFYLRMRMDQRKTVQAILVLQAVGFISFVMAAIALGLTSLV